MKIKKSIILSSLLLSSSFGGFDTMNPLQSSTHNTTDISNNNTVTISWTKAIENGGDTLKGYYYILDKTSSTIMPDVVDTRSSIGSLATSVDVSASSDGVYYFHMAPYAENGNTGATMHYGPITIDSTAPYITITPSSGTYTTAQSVTLGANDANSYTLYYTTDGSTPTTSSTEYSSAISVSDTTTLKVIAKDVAGNTSSVSLAQYTLNITSNVANFGTEISPNAIIKNSGDNAISYVSVVGDSLTQYKYKIDSADFGTPIDISNKIDITSLKNGEHTIYTIGYDGSTWQSEAKATSLTFIVDNSGSIANSLTSNVSNNNNTSNNTSSQTDTNTTTQTDTNTTTTNSVSFASPTTNNDGTKTSNISMVINGTTHTMTHNAEANVNLTPSQTGDRIDYDVTFTNTALKAVKNSFEVSSGVYKHTVAIGSDYSVSLDSALTDIATSYKDDGSVEKSVVSGGKVLTSTINQNGTVENSVQYGGKTSKINMLIPNSTVTYNSDSTMTLQIPTKSTTNGSVDINIKSTTVGKVTPVFTIGGKSTTLPSFDAGSVVNVVEVGGEVKLTVSAPVSQQIDF
jgi:hypothetical protein